MKTFKLLDYTAQVQAERVMLVFVVEHLSCII
jgi:hypothetical protein